MNALWNTAWVTALAAGMAWVAGTLAVVTWLGLGRRGRLLWLAACVGTLALPSFLVANVWLELSAAWRLAWGGERSATAMLPWAAVVLASLGWPVPALLAAGRAGGSVAGALEALPGLRGWAVLRGVAWPMIAGGLATGTCVAAALAASSFSIPTLFQVRVLTESIWVRFNTELEVGAAWWAGLPLTLMALGAAWMARGGAGRWEWTGAGMEGRAWRGRLGGWWWASATGWALVVAGSLGLPLVRLLGASRTWDEWGPAMRAGGRALAGSAGMGMAVAVAAAGLGLALASCRGAGRWRWVAWAVFMTPGILWATPWVPWLARPAWRGVADTALVPWALMTARLLAVGWTMASVAVESADARAWEALRMAGLGRWTAWRLATWPQVRSAAAAAAMATFVLAMWDVETVVLVTPPGMETAAARVFNLLHYGHSGQVNALCVALMGMALAPVVLWAVATWGWRGRRGGGRAGMAGLAGVAALMVAGCSGGDARPRVALESKVFEAAEVIGSRGVGPGQFNKPRSLACDREDNLYVADVTGRIQKFDRDGRFVRQWQMPVTDLGKPKGMGLDPAGRVLVVEPHYMRVNHFDGEGRLALQWGTRGTNAGSFILPRSVAVNSRGEYFLSEYTVVDRVQRFDPAPGGGAPVFGRAWGEPGDQPGQFNRAEGLAVGPNDLVYVADSCNHRIQVFDREGKFLRAHGRPGSNPGEFSYPYDVRVDASGLQFVCEFGNSRVTVLDAAGTVVEVVGGPGAGPGRFANPWSVALDSRGNLYVADSQNHRVQRLVRRAGGGR